MINAAIRVTSIWNSSRQGATFSGVPLNKDGHVKSAKSIIFIKAPAEILPLQPMVGQHWIVKGDVEKKQVTHQQFVITETHFNNPQHLEVTLPHDGEGFIRFVSSEPSFRGIGEIKARELWRTFGNTIFEHLAQDNTQILLQVLTPESAECLLDGFQKYNNLKYTTWFADHHIPLYVQQKLFRFHGVKSINEIKDNPYHLLTFGMPFEQVDAVAKKHFSAENDDENRLLAAVEQGLQHYSSNGGHTVATKRDIVRYVERALGDHDLTEKALSLGANNLSYIVDQQTGSYHITSLLIMEKVVAKRLNKIRNNSYAWTERHTEAIDSAIGDLPYPLTDKQRQAVLTALDSPVSTITGGAGTGKTTVLRTVLRAFHLLGYDIHAVALAGRAAMRLHQSTGFPTSTIAKLLRDDPLSGENTLLVIDESSMVDLGLMYRIVNHTSPEVRLLLVGDSHQLPPIGKGLILSEIIRSGVIPNTELDVVKRQEASSGIPEYANTIKEGLVPASLTTGDITFHEAIQDDVAKASTDLYAENPDETRIITATKAMTKEINLLCQERVNSASEQMFFTEFGNWYKPEFRLNDPVLFTQNNYEAGVQNGSLGRLISIEQTSKHYGVVRLDDNGLEVPLTRSLLDSLELGYCITLHKAQGSQFPRVIVALSKTSMIDRSWIYTAVTRSESALHIVGTKQRFESAVKSESSYSRRRTCLAGLLAQDGLVKCEETQDKPATRET